MINKYNELTETEICVVGYVPVKSPSIAGFNEINNYPDALIPKNNFSVKNFWGRFYHFSKISYLVLKSIAKEITNL